MNEGFSCCVCGASGMAPAEQAQVPSNVRPLKDHLYPVWRCPSCRSIHAGESVDFDRIYSVYPLFRQKMDWSLRCYCNGLLRRLRRLGLKPNHRVLDYGCGSGLLVGYLRQRGYDVCGYDPYSQTHGDPARLERQYDYVVAQDVVEHDPDPLGVLDQLDRLVRSGGMVVVGTPNASGIDLHQPLDYRHPLHQPYHRHIFSFDALNKQARTLGWTLHRYYPTPYTNIPGLSLPMLHHYMDQFDGTLDVLFDRPASSRMWLNPKTWWLLVAGVFLCDEADIMAAFRKPKA